MKLLDIVILSLAVAFLIIGIHQVMNYGITAAYWALMLALMLFFLFNLRKRKPK